MHSHTNTIQLTLRSPGLDTGTFVVDMLHRKVSMGGLMALNHACDNTPPHANTKPFHKGMSLEKRVGQLGYRYLHTISSMQYALYTYICQCINRKENTLMFTGNAIMAVV